MAIDPNANAQNLNLKMSDTTGISCDKCGCQKFVSTVILRRVSPLVAPGGQEAMVPINSYACQKCEWVNDQFLPRDLSAEEVNEPIKKEN